MGPIGPTATGALGVGLPAIGRAPSSPTTAALGASARFNLPPTFSGGLPPTFGNGLPPTGSNGGGNPPVGACSCSMGCIHRFAARGEFCHCQEVNPPNQIHLVSRAWVRIAIATPSLIVPLGVPNDFLVAVPRKMAENQTDVYRQQGSVCLYLPQPGEWNIWNNGTAALSALVIEVGCGDYGFYYRTGYGIVAHSAVSVGVASTAVLAATVNRSYALFQNDSPNDMYLRFNAAAALNTGIRLKADGGAYEMLGSNLYRGSVNAISSVAAQNLLVVEGT